jgi:hypothetical protein
VTFYKINAVLVTTATYILLINQSSVMHEKFKSKQACRLVTAFTDTSSAGEE